MTNALLSLKKPALAVEVRKAFPISYSAALAGRQGGWGRRSKGGADLKGERESSACSPGTAREVFTGEKQANGAAASDNHILQGRLMVRHESLLCGVRTGTVRGF
jgi:hypothetical protein